MANEPSQVSMRVARGLTKDCCEASHCCNCALDEAHSIGKRGVDSSAFLPDRAIKAAVGNIGSATRSISSCVCSPMLSVYMAFLNEVP